jgi:hypothetical protein
MFVGIIQVNTDCKIAFQYAQWWLYGVLAGLYRPWPISGYRKIWPELPAESAG